MEFRVIGLTEVMYFQRAGSLFSIEGAFVTVLRVTRFSSIAFNYNLLFSNCGQKYNVLHTRTYILVLYFNLKYTNCTNYIFVYESIFT